MASPYPEVSEGVCEQLIDLFCITTKPVGRLLLNRKKRDGSPFVGPWNDTQTIDGETITHKRELSWIMIQRHVLGELLHEGDYARLLIYPITPEGLTNITAIDVDIEGAKHKKSDSVYPTFEDAKVAVNRIIEIGLGIGLYIYPEITKSGGLRAWIFHHDVPAEYARALGHLLLKRAGMHPKIEVFPKQDRASDDGTGSGIYLPFFGRAGAGLQVFVNPSTGELWDIDAFVTDALENRTSAEVVQSIVDEARGTGEIPAKIRNERRVTGSGDGYAGDDKLSNEQRAEHGFNNMVASCEYLRKMVENLETGMHIPYDDWIRLLVTLRAFGPWGRKKSHELSSHDDRYNAVETDDKIDSLTGKPLLCANAGCGFNPQDNCGMPPSNVSPIHFAYVGLKHLPMPSGGHAESISSPEPDFEGEPTEKRLEFDYKNAAVPAPWTINNQGLWKTKITKEEEQDVHVLPHAIYVVERVLDIDTEQESATVLWNRDRRVKRKTVSQRMIAATREIIELANDGVLINGGNAMNVMQFLAAFQAEHMHTIPLTHSVSTCGWKRLDDVDVFMWGQTPIVAPGQIPPVISFTAESRESRDLLQGIQSSGMADGWSQIIPIIEQFPVVQFVFLASFLSPFIETLKINQNPVIELASQTSRGKTTALMVAASVWGYPVEGQGLIRSWNATPVYIERYGAGTNNLPMFFDESQNAKPEQLQQTVYQVANGTGKGRGAMMGGVQKITKYRSVFFSAGEAKIVSTASFDGAQARVASFWGSPFGDDQGDAVRRLQAITSVHYGHAGPQIIKAYLRNPEKIGDTMRKIHADAAERLRASSADDVAQRLANLFAGVEAVGLFVNKILGLDWNIPQIVSQAFGMIGTEKIVTLPQRALEEMVSWADSNQAAFYGSDVYNKELKIELAGAFHLGDGTISFMPDRLKRVLAERKYDYETTLRHWRDNGWLVITDSAAAQGRKLRQIKIHGTRLMCPSLTAEAITLARMKGAPFDDDVPE